jgi:hypothetical protein
MVHERAAGRLDDQSKRGGCALDRLALGLSLVGPRALLTHGTWKHGLARRFLRACPLFVQPTEIKPSGAVGGAAGRGLAAIRKQGGVSAGDGKQSACTAGSKQMGNHRLLFMVPMRVNLAGNICYFGKCRTLLSAHVVLLCFLSFLF